MKRVVLHIVILLSFFIFCNDSVAQESKGQLDELHETTISYVKAESIKKIEENLIKAYGAERNSRAMSQAMKKLWESAKGLDKNQLQTLFQRYANASKSSLKKLTSLSPSQLSSYVKDVVGDVKIDMKTLKRIVYGAGDDVGNATLKTLSRIDDMLTSTGKVSAQLLRKLRSEASGLDPNRARAFYDLLKKKFSTDWADLKNLNDVEKGMGKYVGTVVDGVFVLSDAYDIYYSDDDPEVKAIKASSKIVDYGISTGGGIASAAAGGGLGAGLVIAFTANRVSTLYTEIMMLQKEKREAKSAELNEKINNEILARRQLLRISKKIESGEIDNAKFLLVKLQKYLLKYRFNNPEKLLELRTNLEKKAKRAAYNERINRVINEARRPYRKAFDFYQRGAELNTARIYARDALNILTANLKLYPEIGKLKAIPNAKKLISAINNKIAHAPEMSITNIDAPPRVYAGQVADVKIAVQGGIPYYSPVGMNGGFATKVVVVYWQAPSGPGMKTVTFRVKDCMGKIARASARIEVVEKDSGEIVNSPGEDETTDLNIVELNDISGTWEGYFQITENRYFDVLMKYAPSFFKAVGIADDAAESLALAKSVFEEPEGLRRKRHLKMVFTRSDSKYVYHIKALMKNDDGQNVTYEGTAKYKNGNFKYELNDPSVSIRYEGVTTSGKKMEGTFYIGSKMFNVANGNWELNKLK